MVYRMGQGVALVPMCKDRFSLSSYFTSQWRRRISRSSAQNRERWITLWNPWSIWLDASYRGAHFAWMAFIQERKQAEKNGKTDSRTSKKRSRNVKKLSGLIPICSSCKNSRWQDIESIGKISVGTLRCNTQSWSLPGLCKNLYPEVFWQEM